MRILRLLLETVLLVVVAPFAALMLLGGAVHMLWSLITGSRYV